MNAHQTMIDPEFTGLPLRELADAALQQAKSLGAQHADFRAERIRGQQIELCARASTSYGVPARSSATCQASSDGSMPVMPTNAIFISSSRPATRLRLSSICLVGHGPRAGLGD